MVLKYRKDEIDGVSNQHFRQTTKPCFFVAPLGIIPSSTLKRVSMNNITYPMCKNRSGQQKTILCQE